jgi:hypothetical protein
MKALLITGFAIFSLDSFAGQPWLYCKVDKQAIEMTGSQGYKCAPALMNGSACFTGDRARVIGVMNSKIVRDLFQGMPGDYILNARSGMQDNITYSAISGTQSSLATMPRCAEKFFQN